MLKTKIDHKKVTALAAAETSYQSGPAVIKLGVDMHQSALVVAVQEDHATPKPARRFAPEAFVPWVGQLLARGHRVSVVDEACGFGFGLQRARCGRRHFPKLSSP